ncbi:MAG: hypothetical protein Q9225_006038 [Loekoesia sp. 1 TL-2023]
MLDNYTYRALGPNEIRLLSTYKSPAHQTIYRIQHVSLKAEPTPRKSSTWSTMKSHLVQKNHPFNALSYTWDGQEPEYEIAMWDDSVDAQSTLKVTKNLHTALPLLSSWYPGKAWWIDAICINQVDIEEKSTQIPLMRDIYMGAEKVVTWLGECTPDLQFAIDEMGGMTKTFSSIQGRINRYEDRVLGFIASPEENATFLAGVRDLFNKSWFRRTWTVQEAVLPAGTLDMVCGRNILNARAVGDLAQVMAYNAPAATREIADAHTPVTCIEIAAGLFAALELRRSKPVEKMSAFNWLDIARSRLTKLEVDKVYGILGLVEERLREKMKVDYSKSAVEVYVEFVSLWMSGGGLASFVLHFASGQPRMTGLPSWCPNLNSRSPAVSLVDKFGAPKDTYAAGKHEAWDKYQSSTLNPGDLMLLNAGGFHVDVVSIVINSTFKYVPEVKQAGSVTETERITVQKMLAWEKECHDLTNKTYSASEEDPLDVHQRTLIADVLAWERYDPSKVSAGYEDFINHLSHIVANGSTPPIPEKQLEDLAAYQKAVGCACFGRKFFSTRNGRVGLGPPDVQPGDLIVLIPNSPWPFLFRQKDTVWARKDGSSGHFYEYIGDSYVHGIMDGELMRSVDPDRIEEFVLQ